MALASASWCLAIGGFLAGTERGGKTICVNVYLFLLCQMFTAERKLVAMMCLCHRRLQIEELEARIALMPLLQAEHDRR